MSDLKQYHLHAFAHAKLHFEVHDIQDYLATRMDKASRPHRHSYYQLIWFKSEGNHYIDYEVVKHAANTCFLINKHQVHHFCEDSPNDGSLFHFNDIFIAQHHPDVLERWSLSAFSEMLPNHLVLEQVEAKKIQSLTEMIIAERSAERQFYGEAIFHLFVAIVVELERKLETSSQYKIPGDSFQLTARFKKMAMENIQEFWSIDEFADRLHVTTKVLTKATKEVLQQTPAKIIADLKILEAKRMLSNQRLSVKEIGYRLGFEQATYFTKYFKKATGITPRTFRQTLL